MELTPLVFSPTFNCRLHPQVEPALTALRHCAREQGFDLAVASGYRSVARQLQIWNDKARGLRPVLDEQGCPLELASLSEAQLLFAILRWSALPGASRHHWGTDVDIYDPSSLPEGYQLQLTTAECRAGGVMGAFYTWLDSYLQEADSGFFRPYANDTGGVAPEPWHLSYRPAAPSWAPGDSDRLREQILALPLALKEQVRQHWDIIYERFIMVATQ